MRHEATRRDYTSTATDRMNAGVLANTVATVATAAPTTNVRTHCLLPGPKSEARTARHSA